MRRITSSCPAASWRASGGCSRTASSSTCTRSGPRQTTSSRPWTTSRSSPSCSRCMTTWPAGAASSTWTTTSPSTCTSSAGTCCGGSPRATTRGRTWSPGRSPRSSSAAASSAASGRTGSKLPPPAQHLHLQDGRDAHRLGYLPGQHRGYRLVEGQPAQHELLLGVLRVRAGPKAGGEEHVTDVVGHPVAAIDGADLAPGARRKAGLLAQLALGGREHVLIGCVRAPGRDLRRHLVQRVSPLGDQRHFVTVADRDDADRRADLQHTVDSLVPVGPDHGVLAKSHPGVRVNDAARERPPRILVHLPLQYPATSPLSRGGSRAGSWRTRRTRQGTADWPSRCGWPPRRAARRAGSCAPGLPSSCRSGWPGSPRPG